MLCSSAPLEQGKMSYAVRSGSDGHGPEMVCVRVVANAVGPSFRSAAPLPRSPDLQPFSPPHATLLLCHSFARAGDIESDRF